MVDLIFTTKLEIKSLTAGSLYLYVNGTLVASNVGFNQSTDVGLSTARIYDPLKSYKVKSIAIIDSIASTKPDHYTQIIQTGVVKQKVSLDIDVGTSIHILYWNPKGATKPTYFETLDKLDQRASAQYVPKSIRQRLVF